MQHITDIWFRTKLDLQELAIKIGLSRTYFDYENEWEWITGYINDYHLDITRPHSVEPYSTDTRVFLLGKSREFDRQLVDQIVWLLKEIGIQPIYLGQWTYIDGEGFNQVIIDELR